MLGAPTAGLPDPSELWHGTQVSKTSRPRVAASVVPRRHPERFNPPARNRAVQSAIRYGSNFRIMRMINCKEFINRRMLAAGRIEDKLNLP